jgi:membrane protein DedA with SNARE-associated domain
LFSFLNNIWQGFQLGQLPQLGVWNYVILAALVAIEGPIATLIGAAAAAAGLMRLDLVFVAAASGNLFADWCWYGLGYLGRTEWLIAHGRWIGVERRHIERLQRGMHDHARKILLIAKLTAGFMIPTLLAAGMARIPWRRWFPTIAVAELIWTGMLVAVGYHATAAIQRVEQGLHYVAIIGGVVIILLIVAWARRAFQAEEEALAQEKPVQEKPIVSEPIRTGAESFDTDRDLAHAVISVPSGDERANNRGKRQSSDKDPRRFHQ